MQSFKAISSTTHHNHHHTPQPYYRSSFFLREVGGEESSRNNGGRYAAAEVGELDQHPIVFQQHNALDLSRSSVYSPLKPANLTVPSSLHFGPLNPGLLGATSSVPATVVDTGEVLIERRPAAPSAPLITVASAGCDGGVLGNNGHFENWGESGMGDTSQQTDSSTDLDTDDRNQHGGVQLGPVVFESTGQSNGKNEEQKTLRRLAQNREAARKSRLRKKAYVQQLETSRLKLAQLEQELEKARQQGIFIASGISGEQGHSSSGALAFDVNYTRWMDDHHRLINELRSAINTHLPDEDLRVLVDGVMLNYSDLYRLKGMGVKSDVFHMLSGMWTTPAERFFMWLGGFRTSELLKILVSHLEPLTDQQLIGFCNLQQSSQQAEDALSQGMEALQQSLVETLSSTCLGPSGSGNIGDYMGQMAIAMSKLATLENFVHQADLLRQQTLQQLHRILTTRQAARALLVIYDYTTRLRALSSLWIARPKN
ncbi:hypothetical protein V2J09_012831 [Rumex salicifolius]